MTNDFELEQEDMEVFLTITLKSNIKKENLSIELYKKSKEKNYNIKVIAKLSESDEEIILDRELAELVAKEFLWYISDEKLILQFSKQEDLLWYKCFADEIVDEGLDNEEEKRKYEDMMNAGINQPDYQSLLDKISKQK